jgi:hypothetical protein
MARHRGHCGDPYRHCAVRDWRSLGALKETRIKTQLPLRPSACVGCEMG